MFRSLSCLEKRKRKVLKDFIHNNGKLKLDTDDTDVAFALHECIEEKYLDNISDWKDSIGEYHFNVLGREIRVTGAGLKFIKETSLLNIILINIFYVLKGILGFLIGIVTGLVIEYCAWKLGWHQ